jgi:hypothetical protein
MALPLKCVFCSIDPQTPLSRLRCLGLLDGCLLKPDSTRVSPKNTPVLVFFRESFDEKSAAFGLTGVYAGIPDFSGAAHFPVYEAQEGQNRAASSLIRRGAASRTFRFSIKERKVLAKTERKMAPRNFRGFRRTPPSRNFLGFGLTTPRGPPPRPPGAR